MTSIEDKMNISNTTKKGELDYMRKLCCCSSLGKFCAVGMSVQELPIKHQRDRKFYHGVAKGKKGEFFL